MLMSEYNYEQDIEVQREEAFEEGQKAGLKKGEKIGLEKGRKMGCEEGKQIGREEGARNFQKKFSDLTEKLITDGRTDDILKAAHNEELCQKLFQEYKID